MVLRYLVPLGLITLGTVIDVPVRLQVVPYEDGKTPLYSDRPYVNAKPVPIVGYQAVLIRRHLRSDIEIRTGGSVDVVRLLSDVNDNSVFDEWESLEWALSVQGASSDYTRAVVKPFDGPEVRLPPGGPVSASPLLVKATSPVYARAPSSKNKLTPRGPGESWLVFVAKNGKKFSAMALFYLLYVLLMGGALRRHRRA